MFEESHDWTRMQAERRARGQYELTLESVLVFLSPNEVAIVGDAVQVTEERLHGRL